MNLETDPGTENTAGIVGLGAAARLAGQAVEESSTKMAQMRDQLISKIREDVNELVVNGEVSERLPNTASISFPGVSGADILSRVPEISASTGAACHSATDNTSALHAMGIDTEVIRGTVRLSVGWHTNQDEIERASSLLVDAWENLHQPA